MLFRHNLLLAGSLVLVTALPVLAQEPDSGNRSAVEQAVALQKALASARKAGYPVSAKELQPPLPPPEQNAAPLYLQWHDLRSKSKVITAEDDATMYASSMLNANEVQIAAARKVFQEKKEAFALIHAAVTRSQCVFTKDYSLGFALNEAELADLRSMSRFLKGESALSLRDGKPEEAARIAAQDFRIVHHITQSPGINHALVSYAIDTMALDQLRNILYVAGDKPEARAAVLQALKQRDAPVRTSAALHHLIADALIATDALRWSDEKVRQTYGLRDNASGEKINLIDLFRELMGVDSITAEDLNDEIRPVVLPILSTLPPRIPQAGYSRWVDSNALTAVNFLQGLLDASDKPFEERIGTAAGAVAALPVVMGREGRKSQSGVSSTPIAALFCETAYEFLRQRHDDYQVARGDMLRATCQLLDYKARTGAFPGNLQEAVTPLPTDPFDGKPLKYRREGKGFVLYVVGRNHRFDGGAPDKQTDGREASLRYPSPLH